MVLITAELLDRAAGAVLGCAVGDALGAGYEFEGPREPATVTMRPGNLTGRPPGTWTDDTEMTLGVLMAQADGASILDDGIAAVASNFLAWFDSRPPDVGNQTRQILRQCSRPDEMLEVAERFQELSPDAAGNGSLMRTGTVALSYLGNDQLLSEAAKRVSRLTHPHIDAQEACVLWTLAIDRGVRGVGSWRTNMTEALAALPEERGQLWRNRLAEAETVHLRDLRPNGWVVRALQAAWRSIVATASDSAADHLHGAMQFAVGIGDDTDTIAAIAGAYLGAHYGASVLRPEWTEQLGGWPDGLGSNDLRSLAEQAVRKAK